MYIIYNSDGSIRKVNFTEFIQKGNDNVNAIDVAVIDKSHDEYSVTGVFTLPNGESVSRTASPIDYFKDVDGEEYRNGYQLDIDDGITLYDGRVLLTIRVLNIINNVLYTYPVKLTINETGDTNVEHITWSEYDALLNFIKTNYSKPKDFVRYKFSTQDEEQEPTITFDSDVVVLFGACNIKRSKNKKYKPSQFSRNKKGNLLYKCDKVITAGTYTVIELLQLLFADDYQHNDIFEYLQFTRLGNLDGFSSKFNGLILRQVLEPQTVGQYYGWTINEPGTSGGFATRGFHQCGDDFNQERYEKSWAYIARLRFVKNFNLRLSNNRSGGWTGQMSNYQLKVYMNITQESADTDYEIRLIARMTE